MSIGLVFTMHFRHTLWLSLMLSFYLHTALRWLFETAATRAEVQVKTGRQVNSLGQGGRLHRAALTPSGCSAFAWMIGWVCWLGGVRARLKRLVGTCKSDIGKSHLPHIILKQSEEHLHRPPFHCVFSNRWSFSRRFGTKKLLGLQVLMLTVSSGELSS